MIEIIFAIERKQTGKVHATIIKPDCCQYNSQSICSTISMDVLPSVYSEANFEPHDEVTKLTSPKIRLTGNIPREVKFLSRQDRNK